MRFALYVYENCNCNSLNVESRALYKLDLKLSESPLNLKLLAAMLYTNQIMACGINAESQFNTIDSKICRTGKLCKCVGSVSGMQAE